MRFFQRRGIATLADGDETTPDTEATIDEGEAEASDKEAEKKDDVDKEPEFDAGDEEDPVDDGEGGEDGAGEEDAGASAAPAPAPVDDVPAEDQPRHDTGVNSVDIVVKASNIIRNAQDIAGESYGSKKVLDEMFDEADGSAQALGHIALELGGINKAVEDATMSCNALVETKEALNDNFYKDGMNQIGLEAIHILAKQVSKRFVTKSSMPKRIARESFRDTGSSGQTKRGVAVEGIGDMIKAMIDAICDMFRRIWKWIKEFFSGAEKKAKKCEAISKELVKRCQGLVKERKALTKEKLDLADQLFEVCQKFDPDKAGDAFNYIPAALKSKEELVKKAIQERGFRLRRSEIPRFYITKVGFVSPTKMNYEKGGYLRDMVDFVKYYFVMNDIVIEAVNKVLKTVSEVSKDSAAQNNDSNLIDLNADRLVNAALLDLVNAQHSAAELGVGVNENYGSEFGLSNPAVKTVVHSALPLPDEHMVHYYLPVDDKPETIRTALGDLGIKLETFSSDSAREDGLVDHDTFDKIEKGLGEYVERFMKEVNEVIDAQVKLVDRDGKKLVATIEEIKKKTGEGWNLSQTNTKVLNDITKMVTRIMTEVAPKLSKLILNFMTDFLKHSHQSLSAYAMCLEMVK